MNIIDALKREDRTLLEAACEQRANAVYVGSTELLCRVLTKYLMYVPAEDTSLAPHLALSGYWEMWVTQAIARHLDRGRVRRAVDVGANVGYFTLLLADLVGEEGHVAAIEPQARLAKMIERSATLSGFGDRVSVHQFALGDRDELVRLHVPGTDLGSAHLIDDESRGRLVQGARLDSHQGSPVDFIKIDAEGSEAAILRGAEGVIERDRPTLLIEYSPAMAGWHEADPLAHVRALVSRWGYSLREVTTSGDLAETSIGALEALKPSDLTMLWLQPKT